MRGGAVHKNHHNPTLYIESLPQTNLFIMVASPGHILENKKRDRIKLDTYIDVNERKSSRLLLPYILLELSLLIFSLKVVFFVMCLVYKWCWITSSAFYRQSVFGERALLPAIHL